MNRFRFLSACSYWLIALCFAPLIGFSKEKPAEETVVEESIAEESEEVLAGHSNHGEAFNEGPRQAAYLMPGMSNVDFPVTCSQELVQRFFNQGVAQLHGFWYYEAERSFRQAAVLDPECAIAYWGMAMANYENRERAQGFIAEALSRKDAASERERLYIAALDGYLKDTDDKDKKIERKDRAQKYIRDLEKIVEDYPDDVEAKAFLAVTLWQSSRAGLPIVSHVAVDSILEDIFDANPEHPAHHYRIHLWDSHKPERALASAASCGQSSPGIAHMWHMPGHIFSRLHRYEDAVWQQEASARVDHAHMMRDRVMPDQIHNFAHNNEWLIRNLLKVGRVDDALALAKNMQELPRHPSYNTLDKRGSSRYGRERLELTLETYRLWPEAIELANTVYLEPTENEARQLDRLRLLGRAAASVGNPDLLTLVRNDLNSRLQAKTEEITTLEQPEEAEKTEDSEQEVTEQENGAEAEEDTENQDAADTKAPEKTQVSEADAKKAEANRKREEKKKADQLKKLKDAKSKLEKMIAAVQATESAAAGEWEKALELWADSDLNDDLLKAEWLAEAGKIEEAIKLADKKIDSSEGEVLPVAVKAWIQFKHQQDDAKATFEQVQELASVADLETPLLARLNPAAEAFGAEQDHWSAVYEQAEDSGVRPALDSLGPFRWHPYMASDFAVEDIRGEKLYRKQLRGKPTLVIFYLGFGCLHCVEQLHEFSPRVEQFKEAGIDMLAISTEDTASLSKALEGYPEQLNIPLHADPELAAFKAYRCFDDFEQQPLHGTFLIDPDGRVLWQDISYEPFMDVDFALDESIRLLKLAGHSELVQDPAPAKEALLGSAE